MHSKRLIVIIGPTATGKTDLGLLLAKKFNGELVACDSRQVYQGLDIGTGKAPGEPEDLKIRKSKGWWEIDGVKIWLYDLVKPSEQFNAYDWSKAAQIVIEDIEKRGKLPILVGGTGLYLQALLNGLDNQPAVDLKLREQLEQLSVKILQGRVEALSPARLEQLNNSDLNNPRRLIRIIEQVSMYGYTGKSANSNSQFSSYQILKIGLTAPRPALNAAINSRVFAWFDLGIIDEEKNLIEGGVAKNRFKDFGLEYGLIAEFLDGQIKTKNELLASIQIKVSQYAKRQMTWFKRDQEIRWFDITEADLSHRVVSAVENWYNSDRSDKIRKSVIIGKSVNK